MGAPGAQRQTATSEQDCLQKCTDDPVCFAAEYSAAFGCWFHSTVSYVAAANNGVTLYELAGCGQYCYTYILCLLCQFMRPIRQTSNSPKTEC